MESIPTTPLPGRYFYMPSKLPLKGAGPTLSQKDNASFAGVNITNIARTGTTQTITTASAHGFRPGDMVTILFTDDHQYWGTAQVLTVPSSTTFTIYGTGGST